MAFRERLLLDLMRSAKSAVVIVWLHILWSHVFGRLVWDRVS